jgi:predicted DsbA family dithiol-disulfide isomerase
LFDPIMVQVFLRARVRWPSRNMHALSRVALGMQLHVWSDVVCPWCYIGKRRLERALGAWDGEPVDVVWRPFQLDPSSPSDGMPTGEALAAKFGDADVAAQAMTRVTEVAAAEGLEYRMADSVRANTFDAHRLIAFAREQGIQDAVQERLFRAHFCEGAHIGDPEVLVKLATDVGLEGAEDALRAETLAERVRAELAEGMSIGVRSVPTFVVGRRGVAGAQDPEVILELLRSA